VLILYRRPLMQMPLAVQLVFRDLRETARYG
jgi:hypothetical protein